ncbi:MAG: addiction module toxin, HicA family [Acidobacteriota bacterium]|nr:addiction module toxin, HicA family [Acidobacteriota bacterium]
MGSKQKDYPQITQIEGEQTADSGKHPAKGSATAIPRHREIKEALARKSCDELGSAASLKEDGEVPLED